MTEEEIEEACLADFRKIADVLRFAEECAFVHRFIRELIPILDASPPGKNLSEAARAFHAAGKRFVAALVREHPLANRLMLLVEAERAVRQAS